jgi:uncharacterized protein (DUF1778 family)
MRVRKGKKKTGGNRMMELGKRPSQVWLRPEDYELIKAAAALDGRPIAQFIKLAAIKAAKNGK